MSKFFFTLTFFFIAIDRRSISEVPPTPPKRISLRKVGILIKFYKLAVDNYVEPMMGPHMLFQDSENASCTENVLPPPKLLRDSGFSEPVTNFSGLLSSSYEDFVFVPPTSNYSSLTSTPPPPPIPLLSPRTSTSGSLPPPLPPKILNPPDNEDETKSNGEYNFSCFYVYFDYQVNNLIFPFQLLKNAVEVLQ